MTAFPQEGAERGQGGARHRSRAAARRPLRAAGAARAGGRPGDRGGRGAARARPGGRRVRPGRHPAADDRQGAGEGLRRHRGAPGRQRHRTGLGRPHPGQGDQRHRHHAAPRRLPEGADGQPAGGEVHHQRLRLRAARPGGLHRDHPGQVAAQRRLREGRGRGRGVRARLRPAPSRRGGRGAAVRQHPRAARGHPARGVLRRCRCCRRSSATTPGCSSCTRTTSTRCWSSRRTEARRGTLNSGTFNIAGRRGAAAVADRAAAGQADRARAAAGGDLGRADAADGGGHRLLAASRSGCSRTAGWWTPGRCARRSVSGPRTRRRRPSTTSPAAAAAGPAAPGADGAGRRPGGGRHSSGKGGRHDGLGSGTCGRSGSHGGREGHPVRRGLPAPRRVGAHPRPRPQAGAPRFGKSEAGGQAPLAAVPEGSQDDGRPSAAASDPGAGRRGAYGRGRRLRRHGRRLRYGRPRAAAAPLAGRGARRCRGQGARRPVGAEGRLRPGLPAAPGHRRVRGRRVRVRRRADRPGADVAAAAAVRDVLPGRGAGASRTSRPRAAPWWCPTTPGRCRSTG